MVRETAGEGFSGAQGSGKKKQRLEAGGWLAARAPLPSREAGLGWRR